MGDRTKVLIEAKGLDSLIKEIREMGSPPSFHVTGALESVLDAAFAKTQSQVHVISGRLKASGHTESDFNGKVWSGAIHYGGISGTPAYYAIYEMYRGGFHPDGTPHDWFAGLEVFDKAIEEAIDKHFEKG